MPSRATAVFYANPYSDKPFPSWSKALEHVNYSGGRVEIVEGIPPCAFVADHEPWRNEWEQERRQGAIS